MAEHEGFTVEQLEQDVQFLAARVGVGFGASASALVAATYRGERPALAPRDTSDLGRCLLVTLAAPPHRQRQMADWCVKWESDLRGEQGVFFNRDAAKYWQPLDAALSQVRALAGPAVSSGEEQGDEIIDGSDDE